MEKDQKIQTIYQILLKEYKKQNWWPTTKKGEITPSYSGGPKNETQTFEVMVGAILTQNTSWKNVEKAIIELNNNKYLNIEKIDTLKDDALAKLIRSAGYYNQKTKKLKFLTLFLKKNTIKKLKNLDTEKLRQTLLAVHGIGPETADSIVLYAFNKPIFVIDTYTKRIMSRVGICETNINYETLQKMFHDSLKTDEKMFNEYHALLVEHAKKYCKTKPECKNCPINTLCKHYGGD